MAFVIACIVTLHVVSLACLFLVARHSVLLVDEEGRPLLTGWRERIVPRTPSARPTRHEKT